MCHAPTGRHVGWVGPTPWVRGSLLPRSIGHTTPPLRRTARGTAHDRRLASWSRRAFHPVGFLPKHSFIVVGDIVGDMSNGAECPSCGDVLLGVTLGEAMLHLSRCDTGPGFYYFGLHPGRADILYRRFTGEEIPTLPPFDRMVEYMHHTNGVTNA